MTAQPRFPEARRQKYLTGLADEQLAKDDAATALLTSAEAAAEAETKRRVRLGNEVIRHRKVRLEAVGRCEAAAQSFTAAVAEVLESAGHERAAMTELSGPHADTLADVSIMRRFSRYLSHELRQLSGPTGAKFGEIRLCNYFRANLSWEDAERRTASALPGREGNGADDDQPLNKGDTL